MDQFAPIARMRHSGPLPLGTAVTLGICLILVVGDLGITLMRTGAILTGDVGYAPYVLTQMGWVLAVLVLLPRMRIGVSHAVTATSTLRGISMAWPELILTTITFVSVWKAGLFAYDWTGPLALAMAVGFGEELLFRVMLLGWLVRKLPVLSALLISSVIFGIVHASPMTPVTVFNTLPQTAGGLLYGAIYLRTRNPVATAIVHGLWDFPIFVAMFNSAPALGEGVAVPGILPAGQAVMYTLIAAWGLWLMRPLLGIGESGPATVDGIALRTRSAPRPTFDFTASHQLHPPPSPSHSVPPVAGPFRQYQAGEADQRREHEPRSRDVEISRARQPSSPGADLHLPALRMRYEAGPGSASEEERAGAQRTADGTGGTADDHTGRAEHRGSGEATRKPAEQTSTRHDGGHGRLPKFRFEPVCDPDTPGLLGT